MKWLHFQSNVEKYAAEYGKTIDWFKKTTRGVWEMLVQQDEDTDEDTEDEDEDEDQDSNDE